MAKSPNHNDVWGAIDTAPKDGTPFLAYWLRRHSDGTRYEAAQAYVVAHYQRDRIFPAWIGDDTPTHWMPLPAPPAPSEAPPQGRAVMAEKKPWSGRVDRRCPHTMKATDGLGVTYCCDCGKMMKVPKSEAGRLAIKDA